MDPLGGSAPGIGQMSGSGFLSPNNQPIVTLSNDSVITSIGGSASLHSSFPASGTIQTTASSPMPSPIPQPTSFIMNHPNSVTPPPMIPTPPPSSAGIPMDVDHSNPPTSLPTQVITNGPNSAPTPPPSTSSSASTPMDVSAASAELASKMNGNANAQMSEAEKNALLVVLSFLKKHNLKDTEESLKKEAKLDDTVIKGALPLDSDVQTVLSSYANDENPDEYTDAYNQLKNFIDTSLDAYKVNNTVFNFFTILMKSR